MGIITKDALDEMIVRVIQDIKDAPDNGKVVVVDTLGSGIIIETIKSKENMKLEVTKEKVLKAAEENPYALRTLKSMFPEAFEDDTVFCKVGSIFRRAEYPENDYVVFKWNGEVRILNVTQNSMWGSERNLKVSSLKDPEGKTLTVSEFKRLSGKNDLSRFAFRV